MKIVEKKLIKRVIVILLIVILFAVIFLNPFSLTIEYFAFMSLNMKVCEFIYTDTPDKIGGIKISEFTGKQIDEVSKKYNVVLIQYDDNENIVGLFYDVSWVFFMANNTGNLQNMIYAKVEKNLIYDVQLFEYYSGGELNDLEKLTEEQYKIAVYFAQNYENGSKWDKYRW